MSPAGGKVKGLGGDPAPGAYNRLVLSHESELPTRDGSTQKSGAREAPVHVGTILGGRYRIDAVLGFGGMGVVYRARDLKLDQEIALKRIRPDRVSPERRETLRREIILVPQGHARERLPRLRPRRDRGRRVRLDGVPAGKTLKEIEERERMLPLGTRPRDRQGHLQRPGGRAPHRRAAPGLEARERDRRRGRQAAAHGLRHRRRIQPLSRRAGRHGARHAPVPGPGAAARRDAQPANGRLRDGRPALRDVHGPRPVRRQRHGAPGAPRDLRAGAPKVETLRPDLPPELRDILERAIAKDPEARFADATSLADAISAFEGQVLDRVLAEVSVTRAKMVKLMVILEANKSLAATFDPTETLRIILKTATSETDAERGTIFLKDPDSNELVSQILEGGAVNPIRLPVGTGIAGTVAQTGQVVNTIDAYQDPRFDKRTDASSGFKTVSILAAPMRTPRGEIVGVVEILNKRRRNFTKEDEEFLAEVGTHAALAVESVREHEAAVRQARREGAAAVFRSVTPLLLPAAWPETPGFESAPLRWRRVSGGRSPPRIGWLALSVD